MARRTKFTIFDVMDEKGIFEDNPANPCCPKYAGPVPYPKLLYHPKGEKRLTEREEKVPTPLGVVTIPAKYELINRMVNNSEEEGEAVREGWHRHPADSLAASGTPRPDTGPLPTPSLAPGISVSDFQKMMDKIRLLEAENASLKATTPRKVA